jgi:hypothetical protein
MGVIPEQQAPTPQQMQQAVALLAISEAAAQICAPVHLSGQKSVNLRHVESYGVVEVLDEKKDKAGEIELVSKKPPEFKPAITMASGEVIELDEGENDVFRPVWEQFAANVSGMLSTFGQLFPETAQEEVPTNG